MQNNRLRADGWWWKRRTLDVRSFTRRPHVIPKETAFLVQHCRMSWSDCLGSDHYSFRA